MPTKPMPMEVREGSEDGDADDMPMKGKKKKCAACASGKKKGCCNEKEVEDGDCGMKKDSITPREYLHACDLGIQGRSRSYIRARIDSEQRLDLKCGKGSISQGEKCSKGAATKAKGPSALVQAGQAVKAVGRGALEAVKWTSGYNIGKAVATGATRGKNEKGTGGEKAGAAAISLIALGPAAALGSLRRSGAFGKTDLQQHAENERKEKKWRKSVGYKDSIYASDVEFDSDWDI